MPVFAWRDEKKLNPDCGRYWSLTCGRYQAERLPLEPSCLVADIRYAAADRWSSVRVESDRSETLMAVAATISVFWDLTVCSLINVLCPGDGSRTFFPCR